MDTPPFAVFVQQHILATSERLQHTRTHDLIERAENAALRAVRDGRCQPAPADWWEP